MRSDDAVPTEAPLPAAPRPRRSRRRRAIAAVALLVGTAWLGWAAFWSWLRTEVDRPREALHDDWYSGHRVLDRHGRLLRELPGELGRRGQPMPLSELGERIVTATRVSEDERFFEHDGVDGLAVARAVGQNLRHGRLVSGASTITQQLVKLLDTRGQPGRRTAWVKLREAARAENLDAALDKHAILEAYLSRLPYGHGLVGPEAAARGYFGVAARELSWAQAAYLAVLPRAPSHLDPLRHPERVIPRQRALLSALHEAGELSAADLRRALLEPVEPHRPERPFLAPHLVETLRSEGRLASGPVTTTTLDAALQLDVEGLVRTHMANLVAAGAGDAAVMVIDNETAEVLAYVGSAGFHDPEISGQIDMARAPRQPGSTLKPFVYALAWQAGRSPLELLPDVPTRFSEDDGHGYAPQNYHGQFGGPVSARQALAESLNVPAVRLAADLPAGALLQTLRGLGLASLREPAVHYGLSLALGSGEVGLRELAEAYVALARGGEHRPLRMLLDEPHAPATRVLDPAVAAAVTEALSDPLARARLLPEGHRPFDIGFPLALKTGTSTGHRDAWTVGYTRERTVAVWIGNADGSPMHEVTGAGGAGPLFADVMRRAMRDVPTRASLWGPALLQPVEVCALSGHRPGPACPHTVTRRLAAAHVPDEPCSLHAHAQIAHSTRRSDSEPLGTPPFVCDPEGDTVVALLPAEYTAWLDERPMGAPGLDPYGTPWLAAERVPGCTPEGQRPVLVITEPTDGAVIWSGREHDGVPLRAEIRGGGRDSASLRVEYVVDGEAVAQARAPYDLLVDLPRGDHVVRARIVVDASGSGVPHESHDVRFSVR